MKKLNKNVRLMMSISTLGIRVVYLVSNYSEINRFGFVPNFICECFT